MRDLRTEAIAGVTTFFTMAYIVVVNPGILSTPGTGMPFSGALTATVLIAFLMTLMMGIYARLPFAVAPGMGINAFFTFTIILTQKVWWQTALGIIFWAGVLFLLISITPVRETIAKAIPPELRIGTAAGIGIFLTFIGLKNAGIITSDPITFVKLGHLGSQTWFAILGLVVTILLMIRRSALAFLAGIFFVTLIAWGYGHVQAPASFFSAPDFQTVFLKLDILGALKLSLLPAIIALMFTDLFDSISSFMGVAHAADLLDEKGDPRNLRQGLIVDSFATFGAGLAGTSSGTAYVESIAGIRMGGRSGMASVVTALCFLPCFFVAPLAAFRETPLSDTQMAVLGKFAAACFVAASAGLIFLMCQEAAPSGRWPARSPGTPTSTSCWSATFAGVAMCAKKLCGMVWTARFNFPELYPTNG